MKSQILLIEKVILESLLKSKKTIIELVDDTGLENEIINSTLNFSMKEGRIGKSGNMYNISDTYNFKTNRDYRYENSELLSGFLNHNEQNNNSLKFRKVYLSKSEEMAFENLVQRLEKFIDEIAEKSKDVKTKDEKLILWGQASFGPLIKQYMNSFIGQAK